MTEKTILECDFCHSQMDKKEKRLITLNYPVPISDCLFDEPKAWIWKDFHFCSRGCLMNWVREGIHKDT